MEGVAAGKVRAVAAEVGCGAAWSHGPVGLAGTSLVRPSGSINSPVTAGVAVASVPVAGMAAVLDCQGFVAGSWGVTSENCPGSASQGARVGSLAGVRAGFIGTDRGEGWEAKAASSGWYGDGCGADPFLAFSSCW